MEALLAAIVMWLAANFDLPASQDWPRVEMVPARELVALRYRDLLPPGARGVGPARSMPADGGRELVAIYRDDTRTVYLSAGWSGETPAEQSILVHEMVHHLQNIGALKYECPQAREKLAYQAQQKWLALAGKSLADEFDMDPMTLLVTTACAPG
jgi:uncharacterized protein DUF6647